MAIKIITSLTNSDYLFSDFHLDMEVTKKNQSLSTGSAMVDGNDIRVSYDEEAIRNSLNNLFKTRQGEVILSPTFGLPLYKYIGEPITNNTSENIGAELEEAITKWEPRVTINKIYVKPVPDQNMYHIVMDLAIPRLKRQFLIGGSLSSDMYFTIQS